MDNNNILSILEFSCMIYEQDQLIFDEYIVNEFQELNSLISEDGNENQKTILDKIKKILKDIWDKIVELIRAFKRKIYEWISIFRKKFYEITKADQKIAKYLDDIEPEDLEKWEIPKNIEAGLINIVYEPRSDKNHMRTYFAIVANFIKETYEWLEEYCKECAELYKKYNEYGDFNKCTYYREHINEIRDKYKDKMQEYLDTIDDTNKELVDMVTDKNNSAGRAFATHDNLKGVLKNVKEIINGRVGIVNIFMKDLEEAINGTKIEKSLSKSYNTIKTTAEKYGNTDQAGKVTMVQTEGYQYLVSILLHGLTKAMHLLTTLYSRAYADVRKYALSAIRYVARTQKDRNIDLGSIATEATIEWAICEASDDYVYNFFYS